MYFLVSLILFGILRFCSRAIRLFRTLSFGISDIRSTTTYPEAGCKLLLNRKNVWCKRSPLILPYVSRMHQRLATHLCENALLNPVFCFAASVRLYLRCSRNTSQQRAAGMKFFPLKCYLPSGGRIPVLGRLQRNQRRTIGFL